MGLKQETCYQKRFYLCGGWVRRKWGTIYLTQSSWHNYCLNVHYFLAIPSVEQRYGRFFPQMTEERSGNMRRMWCLDRKWPCYQSPKPVAFISLYFKRNQSREIGREKWIYLYFCQTGHRKKKIWFPLQCACGNHTIGKGQKTRLFDCERFKPALSLKEGHWPLGCLPRFHSQHGGA